MRFSCFAQKSSEGPGGRCRTPSLERPIHHFYHPSRIAPAQAHAYPVTRAGEGGSHPSPVPASKRGFRRPFSREGGWILDRLREIQSCPQPSPLYYTDGEEHLFLGTYCRLQLVVCGVKKNFLSSDEKIGQSVVTGRSQLIQLRVDSDDPETVHKQLFLWYKTQIQKHIAYRLAALCPRIPWLTAVPTWACALDAASLGELHGKRGDYAQYASHQSAPAVPRLCFTS